MFPPSENDFQDLRALRDRAKNQSIWRLKNGMEEMVEKLVKKLSKDDKVHLHLNEPIQRLDFNNSSQDRSIKIKSTSIEEEVDLVISSIYSRSVLIKNLTF